MVVRSQWSVVRRPELISGSGLFTTDYGLLTTDHGLPGLHGLIAASISSMR